MSAMVGPLRMRIVGGFSIEIKDPFAQSGCFFFQIVCFIIQASQNMKKLDSSKGVDESLNSPNNMTQPHL